VVELRRKHKTLLCVDDNQVALSGWSLYLQMRGYTVISAATADEGLQLFATRLIDAVILDYAMPEQNGQSVAALMKRLKPDVPILLFTGVSELPADIAASVDAFMVKGGPPAELLKRIDSLCRIEPDAAA
jgi:DNA-binding response OmpR family regulator